MKVAFTSDTFWPRINGVTVSTNIFMDELAKLGHQVELWAPAYPLSVADSADPIYRDPRVHRMLSFSLLFSKEDRLPFWFEKSRFLKQVSRFQPDLVHCQTEFSMSAFANAFVRRHRVPMVMSCHTYFEQYVEFFFPWLPKRIGQWIVRHLTRHVFRRASVIITPTEAMRTALGRYGMRCPIHVVPTGIRPEEFTGISPNRDPLSHFLFRRFPELAARKLLLAVGRIGQEKNVDFLLGVVESLQTSCPGATLLLAGNGPYLEQFQRNITHRGLNDVVRCLGYVARDELKHLYAVADVFTFASVTETQGLVTIEAMMCRVPVVAIGRMGTREVMQGDNGGFLVEPDVAEFSERVRQLLTDPVLHESKSHEAWAYAQNWTASKSALKLESLYRELLEKA
jgi:glycosyltransferase involved in cell wall biosynthesis